MKRMFVRLSMFFCCLLISCTSLTSQVIFRNASFEDTPGPDKTPSGWVNCSRGTTPDIMPGPWNVTRPASDGSTFLGLITRSDGTYESIGQKIEATLDTEECYFFSFQLCRSNEYVNFNLPIRLKIYLSNNQCDRGQLIFNSNTITSTQWKKETILFVPEDAYDHIIFEAYYANGVYIQYNGNLLLDDISPIKICPRA